MDKGASQKPRGRPEYRRINKYFKSVKQYWKERDRRKKVWQLSEKYSYKEIAEKLAVSPKTVYRDMKKVRPYYLRMMKARWRQMREADHQQFMQELEGKSLFEQFKITTKRLAEYMDMMRVRRYNRHKIKIIIDMNDVTDGVPAIHAWPKPPLTLTGYPFYFEFVVEHGENRESLGHIQIG
jgi:transposase